MFKTGKNLIIILVAILVVVFNFIFWGGKDLWANHPKAANASTIKKMVMINDNLVYHKTLYVPVTGDAYTEQIGSLYALTDTQLQVFEIVGQSPTSFLCLLKNGVEYIYQSQKQAPLTVKNLKTNKIAIRNNNEINNTPVKINDNSIIQRVISEITEKNVVPTPTTVSMIKEIEFSSSLYPDIVLRFQIEHDAQHNCYITDVYTNTTWKIGDELMKYMMM